MPDWCMTDRRQRLRSAHLYLVCDDAPDDFLASALRGGVDIVQLRIKDGDDDAILAAARRFAARLRRGTARCSSSTTGPTWWPRPAPTASTSARTTPPSRARASSGGDGLIVGLSTHSPEQVDAAADAGVDYIGVGPVHATPTKPGRPAVGLELVRYAAATRAVAVLRDRRDRRRQRRRRPRRGRDRDRGGARADRGADPERGRPPRCAQRSSAPARCGLAQRSRKRGRRRNPATAAPRDPRRAPIAHRRPTVGPPRHRRRRPRPTPPSRSAAARRRGPGDADAARARRATVVVKIAVDDRGADRRRRPDRVAGDGQFKIDGTHPAPAASSSSRR